MIAKRLWIARKVRRGGRTLDVARSGWFLLGFIPLYVEDM